MSDLPTIDHTKKTRGTAQEHSNGQVISVQTPQKFSLGPYFVIISEVILRIDTMGFMVKEPDAFVVI